MTSVRAIFAATLVLSSCGRDVEPPEPGAPSLAVVEIDGRGDLPAAVLIAGGTRYDGVLGTHCWESGAGFFFCADAPGLPKPSAWVQLAPQSVLTVEGHTDSVQGTLGSPRPSSFGTAGKHGFLELHDPQELNLSDGEELLTAPPGRYVLEIHAMWPHGDGVFSFGITIAETE